MLLVRHRLPSALILSLLRTCFSVLLVEITAMWFIVQVFSRRTVGAQRRRTVDLEGERTLQKASNEWG